MGWGAPRGAGGHRGMLGARHCGDLCTNELSSVLFPTETTSWPRETMRSDGPTKPGELGSPGCTSCPMQPKEPQGLGPTRLSSRTDPQEGAFPGPAWPHRPPAQTGEALSAEETTVWTPGQPVVKSQCPQALTPHPSQPGPVPSPSPQMASGPAAVRGPCLTLQAKDRSKCVGGSLAS